MDDNGEASGTTPEKIYNLLEVQDGVSKGVFMVKASEKLASNRRNTSGVWCVLQDIHKQDGSKIPYFVWCPRCKMVLAYQSNNGTNKLRTHVRNCFEKTEGTGSYFNMLVYN